MEATMKSVAKILVPVALMSVMLGAIIAYGYHPKPSSQPSTTTVLEKRATASALKPQQTPNDEASVADPSWTRWRPLTDF
jgi:hypothetical protein